MTLIPPEHEPLVQIAAWQEDSNALQARIAPHFHRADVRASAGRFWAGLLEPLARRNGWQLAKALGERGPDGLQWLLRTARWDDGASAQLPGTRSTDMRIFPLCSLNRRTMLVRAGALAATFGLGHGVSPAHAHDANLAEHPMAGAWLAMANPPLPDDPEVAAPSLFGVVGSLTRSGPVAHAQVASPASGQMAPAATTGGATFETVAFAHGVTLPNPADVIMIRIGLDPGASVPINHTEPMAGLLLVESGTLTFHSSEPQTVTRAGLAAAIATAEATGDDGAASETIPAGTDVTLNAGEATFVTATATGTLRNDRQAPASGLVTLFVASEGPVAATPA